jgi:hypothetical protein
VIVPVLMALLGMFCESGEPLMQFLLRSERGFAPVWCNCFDLFRNDCVVAQALFVGENNGILTGR